MDCKEETMKNGKRDQFKNSPDNDWVKGKDYKGEQSPYNEYLSRHIKGDDSKTYEWCEANPDVLSESDSPYYSEPDDTKELKLSTIKEVFVELSARQQEILKYYASGKYSLEEIATIIGITKGSVQTQLERARLKIQRKYKKLHE